MTTKKKTTTTKARAKKAARSTTAKKAAAKRRTVKPTTPRDPKAPAPGTTLTRVFKKKTYELVATETGWRMGDVEFRSLTAAARAITGYASVSGPRFFGTDEATTTKGGA
jgi:hypothetical protein